MSELSKPITPEIHKRIVEGHQDNIVLLDLLFQNNSLLTDDTDAFYMALHHGARFHPPVNGQRAYALLTTDVNPDLSLMDNIQYSPSEKAGIILNPTLSMRKLSGSVVLNKAHPDYKKFCEKPFQIGLKWVTRTHRVHRGFGGVQEAEFLASIFAFTLLPEKD